MAKSKIIQPYGLPILLLITAAAWGYGGYLAFKQWQIQAWPQTVAEVTQFDPNIHDDNTTAGPRVNYTYQVNGQQFQSQALNPSPFNYQSQESLKAETGQLQPGAKVPCWYNPADPAESYLINVGISLAPILILTTGLLFAGLAIYGYAHDRRFDDAKVPRGDNTDVGTET